MGIQSNYLLAMSITPCDILRFDSFSDINKGDGTVEIMTIEEKVNTSANNDTLITNTSTNTNINTNTNTITTNTNTSTNTNTNTSTNTNTNTKVAYLQQIPFFKKWELYALHQLAVVILPLTTVLIIIINILSITDLRD